jgi:hypothetical protein
VEGSNNTKSANKSSKQSAKQTAKQTTDLVDATNFDLNLNTDLSALPSIMTRTSRTTNNMHANSSKPGIIAAAALLNHNLKYKTSGFADLSFIDFSCVNFPRIAQNFCELWPRKLHSIESTNSSSQQQQQQQQQQHQPLHNYLCNKCGFYFPCKASLILHKTNKLFASSKLKPCSNSNNVITTFDENNIIANNNSNKKKITSRCQLFMTNSKYLCYEKCLDEIITKIEDEERQQKLENTEKTDKTNAFLKSFDLVHVNTLPIGINGKHLNLTEKLMLKLRDQMTDINHQFIVDLDRWKFMHSSSQNHSASTNTDSNSEQSNDYYHDSNKIHLKPHINLNRPLLIRSKKLKRNKLNLSFIC